MGSKPCAHSLKKRCSVVPCSGSAAMPVVAVTATLRPSASSSLQLTCWSEWTEWAVILYSSNASKPAGRDPVAAVLCVCLNSYLTMDPIRKLFPGHIHIDHQTPWRHERADGRRPSEPGVWCGIRQLYMHTGRGTCSCWARDQDIVPLQDILPAG